MTTLPGANDGPSAQIFNMRQPGTFPGRVEARLKRQDSVEMVDEHDPFAGVDDGCLLIEPKVEVKEIKEEPMTEEVTHSDNEDQSSNYVYLEAFNGEKEVNQVSGTVGSETSVTPAKTFMCTTCNAVFMGQNRLRLHMRQKHNLLNHTFKYSCDLCGKSYDQKNSLKVHFKRRHGPNVAIKEDAADVKCKICASVLKGEQRLRFHMERIHKIRDKIFKFKCSHCPRSYDRASSLAVHRKRAHYPKKQIQLDIKCPLCPKKFISRSSYMAHLNRKHNGAPDEAKKIEGSSAPDPKSASDPIKCTLCNCEFVHQNRLHMHMRRTHNLLKNAFKYNCDVCGESYEQKNSLLAHHKRKHGPERSDENDSTIVTCEICGSALAGKRRLRFHMQRMHEIEEKRFKFKCTSCPCAYDRASSLYTHVKRKHNSKSAEPQDISCSLCPKRFTSRPSYMAHLKRTHKSKDRKDLTNTGNSDVGNTESQYGSTAVKYVEGTNEPVCSQCGVVFANVDALQIHMNRIHNTCSETLQYQCSFCSLGYDKKASLISHVTRKHNKELFCETCKKQFTSRIMFLNHTHVNASVGQQTPVYQCGICKMIYVREGSLAKHMRLTHDIVTGDKTLFCEECGKGFWKQSYLNTHMKIHAGVRYTCIFCQKLFNTKESMRQHVMRHHPTEKETIKTAFPCKDCGQYLANEQDLDTHIACYHTNETFPNVKVELKEECTGNDEDIGHENTNVQNRLKCSECETQCEDWQQVQIHLKLVHGKGNTNSEAVCQHCGLVTTAIALNRHMMEVHNDLVEIMKCKYCNYRTWKQRLLWKHERTHTMEKKFHCPLDHCSYKTFEKSHLQKHMETHKAKVKLYCSKCAFSTNDANIMRYHENEHVTGRKKYSCEHCDYATNLPANIHMHRYKHSDLRRFQCNQCNFTAKYPTSLSFHKKKFHSYSKSTAQKGT